MPCGVGYRTEAVGARVSEAQTQYSDIYQRRCRQNERNSACECSLEKAKERAAGTFGDDFITWPRSMVPAALVVVRI